MWAFLKLNGHIGQTLWQSIHPRYCEQWRWWLDTDGHMQC